jgi:hypothetical protein
MSGGFGLAEAVKSGQQMLNSIPETIKSSQNFIKEIGEKTLGGFGAASNGSVKN